MATVNCDSLRNEFDAKKADIDSHLKNGEITEDAYKSITGVYDMMEVMMAIFLEKKTVTTHPFTRPVHIPRICQRHFRQAQFEWQRVDCIQLLSQNRGNSISGTMPVHRILSGSTPRP